MIMECIPGTPLPLRFLNNLTLILQNMKILTDLFTK